MKRLVTICVILLGCPNVSSAQGIHGNVKLTGNATIFATGHAANLSWTASPGAGSYSVYRGTIEGGPYAKIAAGVTATNYADVQVTHKQTFYYVVTAVNGSEESAYSPLTVAVIP